MNVTVSIQCDVINVHGNYDVMFFHPLSECGTFATDHYVFHCLIVSIQCDVMCMIIMMLCFFIHRPNVEHSQRISMC